jgi:hypothetical protein
MHAATIAMSMCSVIPTRTVGVALGDHASLEYMARVTRRRPIRGGANRRVLRMRIADGRVIPAFIGVY